MMNKPCGFLNIYLEPCKYNTNLPRYINKPTLKNE